MTDEGKAAVLGFSAGFFVFGLITLGTGIPAVILATSAGSFILAALAGMALTLTTLCGLLALGISVAD